MAFWSQKKGPEEKGDYGILPLDEICPDPNQPRKHFDNDKLLELGQSLQRDGQQQPVTLRWSETYQKWMLISGECRWRAARLVGLKTLTCLFHRKALSDEEVLAMQIAENLQRNNLSPIEQAQSFRAMKTLGGYNSRELATRLNVADSTISQALALLELPAEVQDDVRQGKLKASTAYAITRAPKETQKDLARRAKQQKWTSKQIKAQIQPQLSVVAAEPAEAPAFETPLPVAPPQPPIATHSPLSPPTTRRFEAKGAVIELRYSFDASMAQVVESLEDALRQARESLPPLRIAA